MIWCTKVSLCQVKIFVKKLQNKTKKKPFKIKFSVLNTAKFRE